MKPIPCILAGILLFFAIILIPPEALGISPPVLYTIAVAVLVIVWWVTEPIPLAATALLPLVLFPALGVISIKDAAAAYADPVVFLFLGGFIIAASMQRWGLHRRFALKIIRAVGTSPRRLILGFMCATAFVSMWISNTASAMMMMPMAVAIITTLTGSDTTGTPAEDIRKFRICLVLGVAYAATIGGVGTLIGTPANGIFVAQAKTLFPDAPPIDFFMWIKFGVPFVCIFIVLAWLWLTEVSFRGIPKNIEGAHRIIEEKYLELGRISPGERWTLLVFCLTALAWIFENTKNIGGIIIPGLDMLIPGISDGMIAIGGALLLFILPVDKEKGEFTMDWETAVRIPWGIILIFGGGLCLSVAFLKSGFADMFVHMMGGLAGLPVILIFVVLGIAFLLLGELISNTANAAIMVPLMAVLGVALGINPLMLMLLASLIAALGFMLPVATPPNTIAYGTGYVTGPEMLRTGAGLCLIGLGLILVSMVTLVPWAMGITPEMPLWMIHP